MHIVYICTYLLFNNNVQKYLHNLHNLHISQNGISSSLVRIGRLFALSSIAKFQSKRNVYYVKLYNWILPIIVPINYFSTISFSKFIIGLRLVIIVLLSTHCVHLFISSLFGWCKDNNYQQLPIIVPIIFFMSRYRFRQYKMCIMLNKDRGKNRYGDIRPPICV